MYLKLPIFFSKLQCLHVDIESVSSDVVAKPNFLPISRLHQLQCNLFENARMAGRIEQKLAMDFSLTFTQQKTCSTYVYTMKCSKLIFEQSRDQPRKQQKDYQREQVSVIDIGQQNHLQSKIYPQQDTAEMKCNSVIENTMALVALAASVLAAPMRKLCPK